jgi:hypothetical protein
MDTAFCSVGWIRLVEKGFPCLIFYFDSGFTMNLQGWALFIISFSPALAFVVVLLRIYSKVTNRQFGWDDGLIIVAMV